MSWFSLIQAEKSVINSQQIFHSTLTGNFIGEYTVKHLLKNTKIYLGIRETVSQFFSKKLYSPIDTISNEIGERLLERIIKGKTFFEIFPELFTHCHCKAQDPYFKNICNTSSENELKVPEGKMAHLINHIFDEFLANDGNAFTTWIHAFDKGEEALELIAQKALIAGLKPICKKAIKASFHVLIKTGLENAIDGACSSGISILAAAAIYRVALGALCSAADYCQVTPLSRTVNFMQDYLPSPYKALSALTAIHVAEMVHLFWKARNMHLKNTDLNKEQVKAFITDLLKEPIKHALKEKEIFKIMNVAFSAEKIENFIILLIKEMIDNHWDQLHQIQFLNLPLVT